MLNLIFSNQFTKDYKTIKKRNYDIEKLKYVVKLLLEKQKLPVRYLEHYLTGNYKGFRECHIRPNWILIYYIENNNLILVRTGTHSDLF